MKKMLVIDTSVYITYCTHNKLYRLADAFVTYDLAVFVNSYLLSELERNIPGVSKVPGIKASHLIAQISGFTTFVETTPAFNQSPDPKDNFLFDIALQTGSEIIVTQEKLLLGFAASPVAIHNLKWFKENYPVPL